MQDEASALPEKPPTKPTGSCCGKIHMFLGMHPNVTAHFSVGSLRIELGLTMSRRPSRSPTEPPMPA